MDRPTIIKLLNDLNEKPTDTKEPVEEHFRKKYEDICVILKCSYEEILKNMESLLGNVDVSIQEPTYEWKYLCLNFYILNLLNERMTRNISEIQTMDETEDIKTALRQLMVHGIFEKLQPNLPHAVVLNNFDTCSSQKNIIYCYNVLKNTILGLYKCTECIHLRTDVLENCIQGMLCGILQIAYAPLKKPDKRSDSEFIMTEEIYVQFLQEQKLFKQLLHKMVHTVPTSIFVKEIMILFQANTPIWFKKAISSNLTKMLRSSKGVQHITAAMLFGADYDTTTTWKTIDILTKLILSCRSFPDFRENICMQVVNMLDLAKNSFPEEAMRKHQLLIFEGVVLSCTKSMYLHDKEVCTKIFIKRIVAPLLVFAYKDSTLNDFVDITADVKQTVRLLYGCFIDDSVNFACLPLHLMTPFIGIIFHLYHLSVKSTSKSTNRELKELLIKHLRDCNTLNTHLTLDNFLFGFTIPNILNFRNDLIVEINEQICIKNSPHIVIYATADVMDTAYDLLNNEQKGILFGYLLKCLTEKEKYFPTMHNSKELLANESSSTSTALERLLTAHKILSKLSENTDVQRTLKKKPDDVIEYAKNVIHSANNIDSHLVFLVVMILDNLISNAPSDVGFKYRILKEPLSTLFNKTDESELKVLCNKVVTALEQEIWASPGAPKQPTEFEKAMQDVYDPLLPTRGHGLLVLTKLIKKKDKQAMERKKYLLNLFQLYLKDTDSFLYLNAIQGLAALADVFPDTVLEVLCNEYADFSGKGDAAHENRMKLGEVLVRVVKLLGDMAPKYKALLLNTFMAGTKDDDHLIRASCLSNLAEVCRVLNYKLGTIVVEVLVCVHSIITTDKAIEARRAAVTVIQQLFVGLRTDVITFLKEDILPIYRTLKEIYYNDRDDVMKLHAQLALEELNENMKEIVFPNPQLSLEKKIILLN